jgi:hypothetical protein
MPGQRGYPYDIFREDADIFDPERERSCPQHPKVHIRSVQVVGSVLDDLFRKFQTDRVYSPNVRTILQVTIAGQTLCGYHLARAMAAALVEAVGGTRGSEYKEFLLPLCSAIQGIVASSYSQHWLVETWGELQLFINAAVSGGLKNFIKVVTDSQPLTKPAPQRPTPRSLPRASGNKQRRSKKWKLAATVSALILVVILGVFVLPRILAPAEPPILGQLSSTQRHSSGTIFLVPGAAEASQSGGGVETGIRVKTGQRFIIHATGLSGYGPERGSGRCNKGPTQTDPNGKMKVAGTSCPKRSDPAASLGTAPLGSLIARIGSGDWFLVGRGVEVTARSSGELAFAVNDSYYGDNPTSSFKVTVASE